MTILETRNTVSEDPIDLEQIRTKRTQSEHNMKSTKVPGSKPIWTSLGLHHQQ